jgi:alpha-amylase
MCCSTPKGALIIIWPKTMLYGRDIDCNLLFWPGYYTNAEPSGPNDDQGPKGPGIEYFCAGEYVVGKGQTAPIDQWVDFTKGRCGTFDFSFREAMLDMIKAGGFFDMGSVPNFQQSNRLKTVPFINSHDTWRGPTPNSHQPGDGSGELLPTIDPDDPRADVAYAATFAIDGSPVVFYEDLFVNSGDDRNNADPETIKTRDYLVNLIWAHQELNFKDGAYKVPFRGSQDLLVIERAGKALIALNDHGNKRLSAKVDTSFGLTCVCTTIAARTLAT